MDTRIMERIDDIFYSVKGAKHTKKAARTWREIIAEILKDVEKSRSWVAHFRQPIVIDRCRCGGKIQNELVDDIKEERFFRM